jgi:protein-serine/threonine kinase
MVETDRHIGIIMEYASGGELFDHILRNKYLKDNSARRLFAQLVSGVGYLHKKGIVHRDLKLENLLLDRNRNIIITDFGFANTFDASDELSEEIEYNLTNKEFVKRTRLDKPNAKGMRRGDLMQTSCGSPCYAAPELVVSDSLYTGRKVDVWSCGVILVWPPFPLLLLCCANGNSTPCSQDTSRLTTTQQIRMVITLTCCINTL